MEVFYCPSCGGQRVHRIYPEGPRWQCDECTETFIAVQILWPTMGIAVAPVPEGIVELDFLDRIVGFPVRNNEGGVL